MIDLNKDNFEAEVLQAKGNVFVDYYGDGCVPCAELMPFVHELADKYADSSLKFASLNTTANRRLAIGQRVMGLPAMVIYTDGQKVEELVKDDATRENIEAMVKKYI